MRMDRANSFTDKERAQQNPNAENNGHDAPRLQTRQHREHTNGWPTEQRQAATNEKRNPLQRHRE